MQHLAIDLGGRESQICIRDKEEKIILERKIDTHAIEKFFRMQPKSRVIVETCAESFRIANQALDHGHEVRVVPATLVRTLGVGHRGIKTDKRDARVLSEVSCRINLPSVHIRSEWSRRWKSTLGFRQGLIDSRTQLINAVRGWMRGQLIRIPRGVSTTFPQRVRDKLLQAADGMPASVERTLKVLDELNAQIKDADSELDTMVKESDVCKRLMTAPGVGPVVAAHFYAVLDKVERFRHAEHVGAYLGLTPGERSSSSKKRRTGITKAGPPDVRRVLNQGCWCISRIPHNPLAQWGKQISERRGKQIANIAMCRKLSGILFAMWRDQKDYNPDLVTRPRFTNEKAADV